MVVMFDTSHELQVCEAEIGERAEQLFTPLTRYKNRHEEQQFAIDNGAYSRFRRPAFEALLERERERKHLCRFVAVPDVVGSARRTLEVFDYWFPRLGGWALALVCQDGQENHSIPWEHIDAVFIGGTTEWKMSQSAIACIKAAQAMSKWVHVGRVNTPDRFEWCVQLGVDSVDGSGISRYSYMRTAIRDRHISGQLELFVPLIHENGREALA